MKDDQIHALERRVAEAEAKADHAEKLVIEMRELLDIRWQRGLQALRGFIERLEELQTANMRFSAVYREGWEDLNDGLTKLRETIEELFTPPDDLGVQGA